MRTLNRPMFRYGGPIKEGVMHGIREPKRNGGSMANNEGPRRAALVGNPIYPKVDGRTNHALPAVLAAPYIGAALRFAAPAFGKFVTRQIPKLNKAGKNMYKKGMPKTKRNLQTTKEEGFDPNALGKFFANDPLASKAVTGAGYTGKAIQKGYGAAKYATTTPSGLLFFGAPVTYMAGKYFLPDGKEITGNDKNKITQGRVGTSGAPGGGDPGMFLPGQGDASKKGGGVELSAEELRKKNVERYRDIMDIKGMNKDAAYNSLIAASQAINQSGDFKGDIKSGKLINQIIQATSKQFDKPKATKDAINTLIAKAEIEKDMNKEKNALENKKTNLQIKAAEKALAGDSFDEAILKKITSTSGKMPTGSDLAGILKATRGIDSVVLDGSQVTPGGEVKFLQESVSEKIKEGTSVNPGAYVLNSKILIVDEQGNVSQYY